MNLELIKSEGPEAYNAEKTNDDRLFAAPAYVFSPLFPLIILFMKDKRNRPFIKDHSVQALIAGLIIWIILVPATLGCETVTHVVMRYWAYRAYQGATIEMPVITNFVKSQSCG